MLKEILNKIHAYLKLLAFLCLTISIFIGTDYEQLSNAKSIGLYFFYFLIMSNLIICCFYHFYELCKLFREKV